MSRITSSTLAVAAAIATLLGAVPLLAGSREERCAKVAAAIEETPERSAEEIAADLKMDLKSVRECWADWDATAKGKPGRAPASNATPAR